MTQRFTNCELKPCPFCGGADITEDWSNVTTVYSVDHQTGYIDCNQCGAGLEIELHGDLDGGRDKLVSKWNRRFYE